MFDEALLTRLYRYSHALCGNEADAYDLLQGAVERCLRSPPSAREKLFGYTCRIIRNRFIDQWRQDKVVEFGPLDESTVAIEIGVGNLEGLMVDRDELEHAWRRMTTAEREILFLWAVEGYSTDEVARHLDRPRGSVLSIIHRMRKRLTSDDRQPSAEA
jgi:RNA polymerase sigma-70 factor (ECF subfamily)